VTIEESERIQSLERKMNNHLARIVEIEKEIEQLLKRIEDEQTS